MSKLKVMETICTESDFMDLISATTLAVAVVGFLLVLFQLREYRRERALEARRTMSIRQAEADRSRKLTTLQYLGQVIPRVRELRGPLTHRFGPAPPARLRLGSQGSRDRCPSFQDDDRSLFDQVETRVSRTQVTEGHGIRYS